MKEKARSLVHKIVLSIFVMALAIACVPLFKGLQSMKNIGAPAFVSITQPNSESVLLSFDQPVRGNVDQFIPHGGFSISGIDTAENEMLLSIANADDPGREYFVEGTVYDGNNNSLWFLVPFYGLNGNPARIVLSEFITEHSSPKRHEKVELYVQQGGNLGGLSVYNGAAEEHKAKMVFASQEVSEGEYIIVHFRSLDEDSSSQIDEYGPKETALTRASARNATDNARDFWAQGSQGLSDTNGALSIYASPARNAKLVDAIVYSSRNFDPDEPHGSFGTAYTWNVMQAIFEADGWATEHDSIRPDDCLRTEASTSTRSINRNQLFSDTNRADDWHIVPSGKSSFGVANSEEIFSP